MPDPGVDKTPDESRGRVLVVDDEPLLLRTYQRTLVRAGFKVDTVSNGPEAVESAKQGGFDAIVSDICMPEMDGLQLLKSIRQHDLDVPVILVTGGPSVDTAVQAVELGALKYLIKPVGLDDLRETVAYAVSMHRLAQAKREALSYLGEAEKHASDRAGLEATFERAVDRIWMAYQPIVSWRQKRIFGYEALVRSMEPAMPHPGALFDAAERLGTVSVLGRNIRERVAKATTRVEPPVKIFVNLHPTDLLDDLLYSPDTSLARVADHVVLELTERATLDLVPDLERRLQSLRERGFGLAVDDLGAGYSGLSSFARIQPEVAKIDMSLVRDIHKDPTKVRLVEAMLRVCTDMGILVVTEGIEVADERDALSDIGCDLMQGFFFARPAREMVQVEF